MQHLSDKPEVIEGCECAICRMHRKAASNPQMAKFDKAWEIVRNDPELTFARQRLSFHELRHIIRAVAQAFS